MISGAKGSGVLNRSDHVAAHLSQHPSGMAVDTQADVYVTDEGNNEVLKLPPR